MTFVPSSHENEIKEAIFNAGAGELGAYEHCTFTSTGTGQYRPKENAKPYTGNSGESEKVMEVRIEVMLENYKLGSVIQALKDAHPYEEVAYFITPLQNQNQEVFARRFP